MTEMLSQKLETLRDAEVALTEEIRCAHEVSGDDDDVMLNWDEQRDVEYLYDRMDLFAALQGILDNDNIDDAARLQMLDVLMTDAHDVIAERTADIDKANAVINDMQQLLSMCEQAKNNLT